MNRKRCSRPAALVSVVASFALAACVAAAVDPEIRVVVPSRTPAPDGNGRFIVVEDPVINDTGRFAFVAGLSSTPPGVRGPGVYAFDVDGGNGGTIIRNGLPAPNGVGEFDLLVLETPLLNHAGQSAVLAEDTKETFNPYARVTTQGVYRIDSYTGAITSVAQVGQTLNADTFTQLGDPDLNNGGDLAFTARFNGETTFKTGAGTAVLRSDDAGTPVVIARAGSEAPDGRGTFTSFDQKVAINDGGQVAFFARVDDTRNLNFPSGVYRSDPSGGLTTIARVGDASPQPEFLFHQLEQVALGIDLDDAGRATFYGVTRRVAGPTVEFRREIFRGSSTGNLEVFVQGQQSVLDGNGTSFSPTTQFAVNDNDGIAYLGNITGSTAGNFDNTAIFLQTGDGGTQTVQLAREGDIAPRAAAKFGDFSFNTAPLAVNDLGQVAFLAQLDPLDGSSRYDAIFFYDPQLGLINAVQEGDQLLGKTIIGLDFIGGYWRRNDHGNGLSNRGEIVFSYTLSDLSTGVAIFSIPEPATTLLILLGGIPLLCGRMGRRSRLHDPRAAAR